MRALLNPLALLAICTWLVGMFSHAQAQQTACWLEDHAFTEEVQDHQPKSRLPASFSRTRPKLWFWFQVRCPQPDEEREFEILWYQVPLQHPKHQHSLPSPFPLADGGLYHLYGSLDGPQMHPGTWQVMIRFKTDAICDQRIEMCKFAIEVTR